jgi:hypothetical protein
LKCGSFRKPNPKKTFLIDSRPGCNPQTRRARARYSFKAKPGTPEFIREYHEAHASKRRPRAGTFMTIIAAYKAAPEFRGLAPSTRRAYLAYLRLIEDEFGDLPLAALADPRVRGEFKTWRDKYANTPRKG